MRQCAETPAAELDVISADPAPADRLGTAGWSNAGTDHLIAVLDSITDGLISFDAALRLLFVNSRLVALLGLPASMPDPCASVLELLEACTGLGEVAAAQLRKAVLASAADGGERAGILELASAEGASSLAFRIVRLPDLDFVVAFEDMTARRAAEADAFDLAMRDALTGLGNRRMFERQLAAILADGAVTGTEHAVLRIDLDRFKPVNDTLGHSTGDALLRLVARRLRSVLRQRDMVARLGNDEFALIASPISGEEDAAMIARRIIDVVGRPYLVDGHLVNIGARIGVALAPRDGSDHARLLRSADLALYHAKNDPRGTFSFFSGGMDERASARRLLELDLRKALALEEFELHYQPQIEVERQAVIGFEALLRWRHPERGLVWPGDFIPLAEEIGLIVPLGEWVLRAATREAMRWPDELSVAVNVSPSQFEDTDRLILAVSRALSVSGLPGQRLEIEVTETALLRNEASVVAALRELRALGVRVAMDDFGTGYASLSQLHSFPFDRIKIDRSFMSDRADPSGQYAIVRAITGLGVSLGMSTIAEGVETVEQLDRVRAEGCTSVQGYLFGKPVPPREIDALIAGFSAPARSGGSPGPR